MTQQEEIYLAMAVVAVIAYTLGANSTRLKNAAAPLADPLAWLNQWPAI